MRQNLTAQLTEIYQRVRIDAKKRMTNAKENALVSVIIPTYNRETLLKRAIESVIVQTYQNWELIVVDDGSTDGTKDVVHSFTQKDKRIRYFYQENSGAPARPTNAGLKETKGDFIAILQHDDEWLPQKLEKQINHFHQSKNLKTGFIGCHALVSNADGTEHTEELAPGENLTKSLLNTNVIPYPSAVMLKKQVIDDVGMLDERFKINDDWDFWLRASLKFDFEYIPEALFRYHIHGGNITRRADHAKKARELETFFLKHQELYEDEPRLFEDWHYSLAIRYIYAEDASKMREYFLKLLKMKKRLKEFRYYLLSYTGKFGVHYLQKRYKIHTL